MPKITFNSINEIPEALRDTAKDDGTGKVTIDVVGAEKLSEFRDNNTKLLAERDTLQATVASLSAIVGDDPAKFAEDLTELRRVNQEVADGKLKGSDAVAREIEARISNLRTDLEKQVKEKAAEAVAWQNKFTETDARLRRTFIDREVTAAALAENSGVDPRALTDILGRAYNVFTVDDAGKLIPKQGDAIIYGSDGATPMKPSEWLEKLAKDAPYFFKASQGGGGTGSDGRMPNGLDAEAFNKLPPEERLRLQRAAK